MYRIESLLSARLFLYPQLVGERIYFISNMSGRLSLYAMDKSGSVPEPLLPPEIAVQNPHLLGRVFIVFPKLGKILINLDQDGNEIYQPMFIPIEGGYPTPAFGDAFKDFRTYFGPDDKDKGYIYLTAASLKEPINITYRGDLNTGELLELARSMHGWYPARANKDHSKMLLGEGYTVGDGILTIQDVASGERKLLYGVPLDERKPGQEVPLNGIGDVHFVNDEKGLIILSTIFEDTGSMGYMDLAKPGEITPFPVHGLAHSGVGEFLGAYHQKDNCYNLFYNIDGCDWVYEATFDSAGPAFHAERVIVGQGELSNGVLEHLDYEKETGSYAISFSTATSPTQIYTLTDGKLTRHTRERVLAIPDHLLSSGEDASFTSFDGLRVSARLYLPNPELGFSGPRPLVYYIHGGPQGQERPDFAWFSMPLIQFLTLNGFAVFVPNVRGSTGYGLKYTKYVDHDWGGDDRLDHVHAMTKVLPGDPRLDLKRAGVVGRSYGGYMTLTLAFRHPELWAAAVDMFGPYDLLTFVDRIPETWKPYFYIALGHPEKDKDFLTERSPRTYMHQVTAPMLVIQGKNDPRVVERESRDVIEQMRAMGKSAEYLMFENEGHDVLKFENRVTCYNAITDFFKTHLKP